MKKLFALLASVALVGMICVLPALAEEAPAVTYGTNVGDVAKPVVLKTLDGKSVDTAKLEKKSVFVMVNTVCGMCQREMTDIEKNKDMFKDVALYIVVVDQAAERAQSKYKAFLDTATLLHDPDFTMGENVAIYSTPSTLLLDKDGKILFKSAGYKPDVLKSLKEVL